MSERSADVTALDLIFIHSWLDDLGASSNALRVLSHLKRRAGRSGVACSGIRSIAKTCRLRFNTAVAAIRELERHGLIATEKRRGQVTIYRFPKLDIGDSIGITPKSHEVTQSGQRGDSIGITKDNPTKGILEKAKKLSLSQNGAGAPEREKTEGIEIRFAPEEEEVTEGKDGEGAAAPNQNNLSDPSLNLKVRSARATLRSAPGITSNGHGTAFNVIPCRYCEQREEVHPPGVPVFDQIYAQLCKEKPLRDESEERWLFEEAKELHDAWLSNGFTAGGRPIKSWIHALRGWLREKRK